LTQVKALGREGAIVAVQAFLEVAMLDLDLTAADV
jgi:hypothetical protein